MMKLGIRAANLPSTPETAVLVKHIFDTYPDSTPEEVRLAFDMAIAGKLDIDEREVSAYESFSCIYFSKIMNAYRSWVAQQFREAKETHDQRVFTEEEMEEYRREMIVHAYSLFLDGQTVKRPSILRKQIDKDFPDARELSIKEFFEKRRAAGFTQLYKK